MGVAEVVLIAVLDVLIWLGTLRRRGEAGPASRKALPASSLARPRDWIVALSGPASVALLWLASSSPAARILGAWARTTVMGQGLILLGLVHVIAPILLGITAIRCRRTGMGVSRVVLLGLGYYGLIWGAILFLYGLPAFLEDVKRFFGPFSRH